MNGERVDSDERAGDDGGARRPRHGVPGGRAVRLADRGENVGYKLYEETDMPLDEVGRARRGSARLRRARASTSTGCRRSCRAGSGAASRSPARWRPSRGILLYDEATTGLDPITATTVDEEIIKLRDLEERQLDRRHAPAARRVLRRDARGRATRRRRSRSCRPTQQKCDEAEFIMLRDGLICFEGNAAELRASTDPYI